MTRGTVCDGCGEIRDREDVNPYDPQKTGRQIKNREEVKVLLTIEENTGEKRIKFLGDCCA